MKISHILNLKYFNIYLTLLFESLEKEITINKKFKDRNADKTNYKNF